MNIPGRSFIRHSVESWCSRLALEITRRSLRSSIQTIRYSLSDPMTPSSCLRRLSPFEIVTLRIIISRTRFSIFRAHKIDQARKI